MDTRFPTLLPQGQIDPRRSARSMALPMLPSLPYGEWLIAAALVLLLLG